MSSSIEPLTMPGFDSMMADEDTTGDGSIEEYHSELRRSTMPLHNDDISSRSGQVSLSLVAASLLHRTIAKPTKRLVSPPTKVLPTPTTKQPAPQPTSFSLLESIPKEVLARDILGFLTDKGVKTFFDTLGERRMQSQAFSEFRNQFCTRHGSKLEDPETFVNDDTGDEANEKDRCQQMQILRKPRSRKRSCPECHAEEKQSKRCHGCKVFFPNHRDRRPGLSCQKCDHLAFCSVCLSNEKARCNSAVLATTLSSSFGRKHRLCNHNGRSSCLNYCCPNVFTNTMCGEFVCLDCSDENEKHLRKPSDSKPNHQQQENQQQKYRFDGSAIETCEECGKSTCLDPHCLVCADFKLIHMSCKFSPDDAYKVDIGGILFGSKNNGSNLNLSTTLRRNLSDCVVWIFVFMALSKCGGSRHSSSSSSSSSNSNTFSSERLIPRKLRAQAMSIREGEEIGVCDGCHANKNQGRDNFRVSLRMMFPVQ